MLASFWTIDELLHQILLQEKSTSRASTRMPVSGNAPNNDDHKGERRHSFSSIDSSGFSKVELDYLLDVCTDMDDAASTVASRPPQSCSPSRTTGSCTQEERPAVASNKQEHTKQKARTIHLLDDSSNLHYTSTSPTCHTSSTSFSCSTFVDFASSEKPTRSPPRRRKRRSTDMILARQPKARKGAQKDSEQKKSSSTRMLLTSSSSIGGLSGETPTMPEISQINKDNNTFGSKKNYESFQGASGMSTCSTLRGSIEQQDGGSTDDEASDSTTLRRRARRRTPIIGRNKYEASLGSSNVGATNHKEYDTKTGQKTEHFSSKDPSTQASISPEPPQIDFHLKRLMNFMVASDTTRKMIYNKVRETQAVEHEDQNAEEQQEVTKKGAHQGEGVGQDLKDAGENQTSGQEQGISYAEVKAARRKPRSSRPPLKRP